MAWPYELNAKQQRFVAEYLVDLNATQAAIRAGYSAKTAQEQSSRLLSNAMVAAAVQEAQAKRAARVELTQDYVLTTLTEVVERCMQRRAVLDGAGQETGEWKFDAKGATAAAKLIGDHLGVFNHKGPDGTNELIASLLRDGIRATINEHRDAHQASEESGPAGSSGPPATVADAGPHRPN